MFNENQSRIGRYYIYSILFHLIIIGLIAYLAIKYKPEIQSIGSNVVVSVISRIPGRHVRVIVAKKPLVRAKKIEYIKVIIAKRPLVRAKKIEHVRVIAAKKPLVKIKHAKVIVTKKPLVKVKQVKIITAKKPLVQIKKVKIIAAKKPIVKVKKVKHLIKIAKHTSVKPVPVIKAIKRHVSSIVAVSSGVYAKLSHKVSLGSAYKKVQTSLAKGNIHKFIDYMKKIKPIILNNFNIPLSKYLSYKSVVAIQITDLGSIYAIKLVKSSGNSYFDAQSIEAIKLSSPLPPTPKGFMSFMNSKNAGEGVLIKFDPKEIIKNK